MSKQFRLPLSEYKKRIRETINTNIPQQNWWEELAKDWEEHDPEAARLVRAWAKAYQALVDYLKARQG